MVYCLVWLLERVTLANCGRILGFVPILENPEPFILEFTCKLLAYYRHTTNKLGGNWVSLCVLFDSRYFFATSVGPQGRPANLARCLFRLHAPRRPMTEEEREAVLLDCQQKWDAVPEDEKKEWSRVHEASKIKRKLDRCEPRNKGHIVPAEPFEGLWGGPPRTGRLRSKASSRRAARCL